jgi:hypothetical protein
MKIFKITDKIEIICSNERTRYGFRHLASLMINGNETDKAKCCYYNRTWERYEFQSVMQNLISKTSNLSDEDKQMCKNWLEGDRTDWSGFKTIGTIAMLGEIFGSNQKEKNDWKTRMLKAGLENKGLEMPEDWEQLDENTKEARLNAVIELTRSK